MIRQNVWPTIEQVLIYGGAGLVALYLVGLGGKLIRRKRRIPDDPLRPGGQI